MRECSTPVIFPVANNTIHGLSYCNGWLKNNAQNERYVSGIFDNKDNHLVIM
jgi:hypothetical protein